MSCNRTVAYGTTIGDNFTDIVGTNPPPCGVDITAMKIGSGYVVYAIQMTYTSHEGDIIVGPRRGGAGGDVAIVQLQEGERITGATGMFCTVGDTELSRRVFMVQLVFFSERQDGQSVSYGPYGSQNFACI